MRCRYVEEESAAVDESGQKRAGRKQEVVGMDKKELAVEKHRKGYNCCQAVVCSFADEVGLDESLLYRIGEGFGAGMGTGMGVCGAMIGAGMLAGLVHSDGNCEKAGQTKPTTIKASGQMQRMFIDKAKRLYCKDIKRGNDGAAFTSCDDCIRYAAETAQQVLGL